MIYLNMYKMLKSQDGKITSIKLKRPDCVALIGVDKVNWDNSFNEFDIFDPEKWKYYLGNIYLTPNNEPLPNMNSNGDPIRYEVYAWGTSTEMQEYFNIRPGVKGQGGRIYLFPGYDGGLNRKDIIEHGRIRAKKKRLFR